HKSPCNDKTTWIATPSKKTSAPMTMRFISFLVILLLVSCDSNSDESCLTVTPDETYTLSGTAMTTDFTPAVKTYAVRNTCTLDVMLSVEEDVRWLDVEIDAFGDNEAGTLSAGVSIDVDIEVRYGSDNIQRLDQLEAGSYSAELRFVDETNTTQVDRLVTATVNSP
ncbi:MAG: hypothetical protein AB8G77_20535, partial [Rhodothermales bacterium]